MHYSWTDLEGGETTVGMPSQHYTSFERHCCTIFSGQIVYTYGQRLRDWEVAPLQRCISRVEKIKHKVHDMQMYKVH